MAPFRFYKTPKTNFSKQPKAMASSSSHSSGKNNPTFSREEFKLFHTVDRVIFGRMVLNLGRDPGESMHVMALLIWLELGSGNARNLVHDIQSWSDSRINALADEAVQCLHCIKSDEFPFNIHFEVDHNFVIPLIRELTNNGVSLRLFHDNRLLIIPGVVKLVEDVCVPAFDDIVQQALGIIKSIAADDIEQNLEALTKFYGPLISSNLPVFNYSNSGVTEFGDQKQIKPNLSSGDWSFFHEFITDDVGNQRETLNDEVEELLNRIHIICIDNLKENNSNNNKEKVKADDRTIFLTFSKGYPISETEVQDFFTGNFGKNLIEVVEMQEVPAGEQPLYAKLVLHSASGIGTILNGMPKAKFSINGKHLWARKFMRKYSKLPIKMIDQI